MESLPMELILQITRLLDPKDVAACCGVSTKWRDIFGEDEVWEQYCNSEAEEYLSTTPCRVQPAFSLPEVPESSLSPLGRWRRAFLREAHLYNNWTLRNFRVISTVTTMESIKVILFINNDFVIVFYEDWMELRNTTVARTICVAQIKMWWGEHTEFEATVVRSDLVVILDNRNYIQVVEVDVVRCTLNIRHAFFVDGVPHSVPLYPCNGFTARKCAIVGNLFLGFTNMKAHNLYLWNVESEVQLKVIPPPLEGACFYKIFFSKNCDDVIVNIFIEKSHQPHVDEPFCTYVYNVKSMRFLTFKVSTSQNPSECAVIKNCAAMCLDSCVKVYNYIHSTCLFSVPVKRNFGLNHRTITAHNNKLIFHHGKVLESYSPSTGRRLISNEIAEFFCCDESLVGVITSRGKREVWNLRPLKYSKTIETVWNIKNTKANPTLTKLLVPHEGEILIYVFW